MVLALGLLAGAALFALFADGAATNRDREHERAMKAALCQRSGCDIQAAVRS